MVVGFIVGSSLWSQSERHSGTVQCTQYVSYRQAGHPKAQVNITLKHCSVVPEQPEEITCENKNREMLEELLSQLLGLLVYASIRGKLLIFRFSHLQCCCNILILNGETKTHSSYQAFHIHPCISARQRALLGIKQLPFFFTEGALSAVCSVT